MNRSQRASAPVGPAQQTRQEYATTLRKWVRCGGEVPLGRLGSKGIRESLDWVHDDAAFRKGRRRLAGGFPGR